MLSTWETWHERASRMNRRTFLKVASMGSVAFATGCSANPEHNLYSMVEATEDMVTGQATWYAATCRECPAGCGVLAKNREGRVIKLEGNPLHPVNQGALCMRGQAALQGLYNPDRLQAPQLKTGDGWQEISFQEAENLIRQKTSVAAAGGSNRVAMLTETVGQTQLDLFTSVLGQFNSAPPVVFEPLAHEALKFAHQRLFGAPTLPVLHLDQCDLLLGFGADFLETWLSPVEYARKFKAMHAYQDGKKGRFIQVSPFQSLTGANADRWIACRPGTEALVMLGLIRALADAPNGRSIDRKVVRALSDLFEACTPEAVARHAGVSGDDQAAVAGQLLAAKRPLVLGTGASGSGDQANAAELAALLLNLALDPELTLFDFNNRHRVEIADGRTTVLDALAAMEQNNTAVVLLNNVNPVFTIPGGGHIAETLADDRRFTVAFASFMDETSSAADLVVPVQMALETWDAYESHTRALTTTQPAMGRFHFAPALGDLLIGLLPPDQRPAESYQALVTRTVLEGQRAQSAGDWLKLIQQGGRFQAGEPGRAPKADLGAGALLKPYLEALPDPGAGGVLITSPSIRLFDGRGANRPWLVEIPETLTQIAWQTPALVHPDTMASAGIVEGDSIIVKTAAGEIEAPAYAYTGVFPGTVVMPAGQGHTDFGRWASGRGANPFSLMDFVPAAEGGAPAFAATITSLEKSGRRVKLASTSGSRVALDRKIAPSVAIDQIGHAQGHAKAGLTMDSFPLTPPTPAGYDPARDLYPPHDHDGLPLGHDRGHGPLHRLQRPAWRPATRRTTSASSANSASSKAVRWPGCKSSAIRTRPT